MKTETIVHNKHSVLNVILWIVQVVLAVGFGMAGFMKATAPINELTAQMVWPGVVSPALVRFIGVSEFLAAVGLLLPSILRIIPLLTVWAALGIVTVMICALIFHINRGEFEAIPVNLVFAAFAGFVAWGRSRKAVIYPK